MDLAIVIPVYNEEENIQHLIEDFYKVLVEAHIDYTFFIINDGSTDGSLHKLELLSKNIPNLQLLNQENSGHGPALLKGYQCALNHKWIFQFDSDYQYTLSAFTEIWSKRENYDLLIAERETRSASFARYSITVVLKLITLLLYGKGLQDINVPYRLMRAEVLKLILKNIHPYSFAPNTLITAYCIKKKVRIFSAIAEVRQGGYIKQSKLSAAIFKGCIQSILDLMTFRFKI